MDTSSTTDADPEGCTMGAFGHTPDVYPLAVENI